MVYKNAGEKTVGWKSLFTVTGVDFSGVLHVRNNVEETKVYIYIYICLFTCANTRAIHFEIVTDLSTEIFLVAF